MYLNGLRFISRLIKSALCAVLVGVCIGATLSAMESDPKGKEADTENSEELGSPSSSSSSSSFGSQEDWQIEGNKLTVSVHAIRELDPTYLERIKNKHPNIREIQVVHRPRIRITGQGIKFLGQWFPDVTVLRLNGLWLRQDATNFFGRANVFPHLSELYLDDNPQVRSLQTFTQAPFASTLTRLGLTGTKINSSSKRRLRKLFPQARVIFSPTKRVRPDDADRRASMISTSSSSSSGQVSSKRSRLLTSAPLQQIEYARVFEPDLEDTSVNRSSEEWLGQSAFQADTVLASNEIQRAELLEEYIESNTYVEDAGDFTRNSENTSVNLPSEEQPEQSAPQADTMLPEVEVNPIYEAIDQRDVDLVREILRAQPRSLYPQVGSEGLTPLQVVLLFIKPEEPVRLQLLLAILEGALQSYDNAIFEEAVSRIDDAELKALLRELLNAGSTFSNTAPEIMERLQQLDEFRERREAIGDIYEEPSFSEVQQAEFPEVYAHAEDAESFAMSPGAVSVDSSVYEFSAESISSEDEEELIDESIDQPSSTSSSSSSSSFQEGWRVEDDKLTVSIEAIRRLGPELLKISQEHPNIQEIQVIRDPGHRKLPITQADVLSLGGLFPRITILRLNNLSMRQWIVEALAWADIFPDLSELYLDNNGQIEGIEVLSHAPFARNLTKLSLAGTKVKHLSEEQLKQLFPQVKEVIFSTPTSISSSSTASTPQEHWRVEGNKLTVSIYAIRNLGMALFRLIGEYSNIREIQVVRGTNQETQVIAEADVLSLGAFFPSITVLRLNGLNLRQNVALRLAYANFFANLSELYLDDNSELEDVEMLSRAPFARNLTRLSLVGTGVDPSNPERLRQLFPHAEVIFGTPERAAADNVQESARTTGANSGASREEESSIYQAIEQRDVNLVREILRAQSGSLYYQVGYERQTPLQAVLSMSSEDPVRLQLLLAILEGALQFSDNTIFNQVINLRNAELKALLRELLNASSSFRDTAPAIMERLEHINERRVRQLAIGDIYEEVSWIEEQRARLPEAFAQDLYESVFNEGVSVDSSGDELVGESISQVEDMPSGEGIHEPSSTSSSSSSSFSSSQENWRVEGDKLTVSAEAIKKFGSDLLERIKRTHPNIQEIQVVRRLKLTKIAAQDIKLLGEYFRDITVLRLNSLTLRQHAVEVLAWANIFPDLSELYLDDNNTFNNVEVLSKAPFAQALTRLSLQNTQVNPLSEGHLRQLFPQVREVIFSTSTSSSSSSSASNLQENWVVEGDRLTVSVEEIKELGPDLLKRIKSNYPNIQEIQVVRRSWGIRLAGQDIMLLGQHFPDVTVLRLNGLNLRQRAANVFGRRVPVPLFPRLFELYLDNNGEVEDVEVLARAPFVSTLTRLSLADTRVDPSSAGRLRQLFPHAEVTFSTPERAEVDNTQESARTTSANSGASREEESSIYQEIERRDANLAREIPRVQPASLYPQVGYERQALLQAVLSMSPEDPVRIQLLLAVLEGALRLPDGTIFGQIINQVDDAMFKALLRELFNVGSRFNDAAPQIIERLQQVDVLRVGNALGALYNELSPSERQRADQLTNAVNARMDLQRPIASPYYFGQPGMFWD